MKIYFDYYIIFNYIQTDQKENIYFQKRSIHKIWVDPHVTYVGNRFGTL